MGNSFGGKKTTKVMKINGETMKLKTPIKAGDVVKDYPGFSLLESEAVKHYGIRAKPLEPHQELKAKRLYFLVDLPKTKEQNPRRVRSGINMSAKDRLESLMLSRRSISDLTIMKQSSIMEEDAKEGSEIGGTRLKMRIPKSEVERLMRESKDEGEAAQRIMRLCMASSKDTEPEVVGNKEEGMVLNQQMHWKGGHVKVREGIKAREKRVSFLPINEGEIQIAVA
ncbi:Plastid movement impaired protein [Quillaja saponaria]|uniref:Plastid movement impaired protein n=1 Tax=Quillaja saponaria TaxID=32244 RepID=A0AAD7LB92_QUISA|nr:Plastid movement impaired protein [Quillaja saponaria]